MGVQVSNLPFALVFQPQVSESPAILVRVASFLDRLEQVLPVAALLRPRRVKLALPLEPDVTCEDSRGIANED